MPTNSHRDTSIVWGQAEYSSSDPNFVKPGAIAWLRVKVVGTDHYFYASR
jgi:hypothetical protein